MQVVSQKDSAETAKSILLGIADADAAERMNAEMLHFGRHENTGIATSLDELRRAFVSTQPCIVLLDETLLDGRPLASSIRLFESCFPVVFLASASRQREAAELVARGQVEYVAREGEFFALAGGLIERRLRAVSEASRRPERMAEISWPGDIGEVFRHEINNPLTGILGNAELVLAHRERLSTAEAQRLETVVDLAVRLRETIRRLSNSIQVQHKSAVV